MFPSELYYLHHTRELATQSMSNRSTSSNTGSTSSNTRNTCLGLDELTGHHADIGPEVNTTKSLHYENTIAFPPEGYRQCTAPETEAADKARDEAAVAERAIVEVVKAEKALVEADSEKEAGVEDTKTEQARVEAEAAEKALVEAIETEEACVVVQNTEKDHLETEISNKV